eukprot:CAMPEP_0118940988 /NCGR_PEP_ID=MMETSP1169-20130426/32819_1 /TAXON_ID=36882 /ORGANISM="Pyramimonas obovata, Strain CCMP722" /LENGTH=277 /DNA_ID=CAMNT_0006885635 /DNA_START=368 /DNA_END=1197 /DNA_ORIENTATION=+
MGLPRGGITSIGNAAMSCSSGSSSSNGHAPSAQARGGFPSSPHSPLAGGPFASHPSNQRHQTATKLSRSLKPQLRSGSGLDASTAGAASERIVLGPKCAGGLSPRSFRTRERSKSNTACGMSNQGEVSTSSSRSDGSNTADTPSQREPQAAETHAVELCETQSVGVMGSLREALEKLQQEMEALQSRSPLPYASGVLRLEASVPQPIHSLQWLSSMPQRTAELLPRTYYSSRSPPPIPTDAPGQVQKAIDPMVGNGSVGGAGAAISWQGRHVGTRVT